MVHISCGKGKVKENLGAKLAILRYGPLLRRPRVLGGPQDPRRMVTPIRLISSHLGH